MSYVRFMPDDKPLELPSVMESGELDEPEVHLATLEEEAISAQRWVVSQAAATYVPGSMETSVVLTDRKMTPQKLFNVQRMYTWSGGDPEEIAEVLSKGRVRARVDAVMGVGKSTRFAPYLAKRLDMRVLLVAPDAAALQDTCIYVEMMGYGKFSRRWMRERRASLACMTYADFCGYPVGSSRSEMFSSFDLVIFDESFFRSAYVYAAKAIFSAYAPPGLSLLCCSATLRTDTDASVVGSKGLGTFKLLDSEKTPVEAMQSGNLLSKYLVDKTIVILPTDDMVMEMHSYYEEHGVEARLLTSASSADDKIAVQTWLDGDSTVIRVLVAHTRFSLGFNFPLDYEILYPYRSYYQMQGNHLKQELEPLSEDMVSQAKARLGRGLGENASGLILSSARAEGLSDLYESEKMLAFFLLYAASIVPLRSLFAECYNQFPDGLQPAVAHRVLKVCLPVEVTVRFLAKDGSFPKKYTAALNVFSQPDHYHHASQEFDEALSNDDWGEELIGDKDGEGGVMLKVPCTADGVVGVAIHAIVAMSEGMICVPRWRPMYRFSFNDGRDSFEEDKNSRYSRVSRRRLARIEDVSRQVERLSIEDVQPAGYRFAPTDRESRRDGRHIDSSRFKEAVENLDRCLLDYQVPSSPGLDIHTLDGEQHGVVPAGTGQVETPGGSVLFTLPLTICSKLNMGLFMDKEELFEVIDKARSDAESFVSSKLFDNYSRPWDSVLLSLLKEENMDYMQRTGMMSDATRIVDLMRGRFGVELATVLSQSGVFKRTFFRVFRVTPSVDQIMNEIRCGKFDSVAQTAGFRERVRVVKAMIDDFLVKAERVGTFVPGYITNAQRGIPIRGYAPLGVLGENIAPMPSAVQRRLRRSREFRDGGQSYASGFGGSVRRNRMIPPEMDF